MEIVPPLPNMPASKLANATAVVTITSHVHLFVIVMPIKTDHFEALLESHLNKLLIESVCKGLCQGFWPYVNFDGNTPTTWDNSSQPLTSNSIKFSKILKSQQAASHLHSALTCSLGCTAC